MSEKYTYSGYRWEGARGGQNKCHQRVYLDDADDFYFWIYLKNIIGKKDTSNQRYNHPFEVSCALILDRTRGAVRPLGGYLGRGPKNHKNHQKVRKKRVSESCSRPA